MLPSATETSLRVPKDPEGDRCAFCDSEGCQAGLNVHVKGTQAHKHWGVLAYTERRQDACMKQRPIRLRGTRNFT